MTSHNIRYIHTASTPGGDGTTAATAGPSRAFASFDEWQRQRSGNLAAERRSEEVVFCADSSEPLTVEGSISGPDCFVHIRGTVPDWRRYRLT